MIENDKDKQSIKIVKASKWEYTFYLFVTVIALVLSSRMHNMTITLGNTGEFTPALFLILSGIAAKWLPILSGVGLVFTVFKQYFNDIANIYIIITATILGVMFLGFGINLTVLI